MTDPAPVPTVLFDDCDYFDSQELLHDGALFTGCAVERLADGRILSESHFRNGIPDGIARVWSHAGVLTREERHRYGLPEFLRLFHPDGTPARELRYDDQGRCISEREWDVAGRLTLDWSVA